MTQNKLAGHTAYLSGPMDRIEWDNAVEWRDEMDYFLHEFGIGTLNPCSKPSGEQESPDFRQEIQDLKDAGRFDEATALMKPVVRVDLRMVDRCDFIICHVDLEAHLCGTYWELTAARMARKPAILHIKQGKAAVPNWLLATCDHNEMFERWDAVQRHILSIHRGEHEPSEKSWHFFNIPQIFGRQENPVETCSRCGNHPAEPLHSCPYSDEIGDGSVECDCCPECTHDCIMSI